MGSTYPNSVADRLQNTNPDTIRSSDPVPNPNYYPYAHRHPDTERNTDTFHYSDAASITFSDSVVDTYGNTFGNTIHHTYADIIPFTFVISDSVADTYSDAFGNPYSPIPNHYNRFRRLQR